MTPALQLCDQHQQSHDAWLEYQPAPWRGQCYRCHSKGAGVVDCQLCKWSLDAHREQQRNLVRRQLEFIATICQKHQRGNSDQNSYAVDA